MFRPRAGGRHRLRRDDQFHATDSGGSRDTTGFQGSGYFFDVVSFEGTAGQFARLSMDRKDSSGSGNPLLYLLSPSGNIVDRGRLASSFLPEDGQYRVVATSQGPNDRFEYRLSLACEPRPEPQLIECNQPISGELEPGDSLGFRGEGIFQDLYALRGTAGEAVTIFTSPIDIDQGDTALYLLDSDGNLISSTESYSDYTRNSSSSLLDQRLPDDGEDTIVATSGSSRNSFSYDLSLACASTPVEVLLPREFGPLSRPD